MGEAIEQGRRHLEIAENVAPFAEAQIGGDDDAGALVKAAEEMEQQSTAGCAERQVSQFVEDDEIEAQETVCDLSGPVGGLFLLQGVDEIDGGPEPRLLAVMLDRLHGQRRCQMGLAGARSTDEHDVLGPVDEIPAVELAHHDLVDFGDGEVEAGQVLVGGESGGLGLIGDGAHLALGQLGFQELERTGMDASNAGALCSVSSAVAWAMPYIRRPRSMTIRAPAAGS